MKKPCTKCPLFRNKESLKKDTYKSFKVTFAKMNSSTKSDTVSDLWNTVDNMLTCPNCPGLASDE